jgi:hypothetical protein
MLGTVRIQGGDATTNNTTGNNWVPTKQVTTAPSFLTKLVVFVRTAVAANRVIWIFDNAAGSSSSTDPLAVLVCPPGATTTLDFGDYGKIFTSGIYITVATNEPADATTTPTAGANNDAKISVDYKVK